MKDSRKKRIGKFITACMIAAMTMSLPQGAEIPAEETGQTAALKNPRKDSAGNTVYDCIWFGSYPQSDTTGHTKEPVKWRVLSVEGNTAFLIADQLLDVQSYHSSSTAVTWESCALRKWLNGSFADAAFTTAEQDAILVTETKNENNVIFNVNGGKATEDKIFLLSYHEAVNPAYGFSSSWETEDNARLRKYTAYTDAKGYGGKYSDREGSDSAGWWYWYLRTPGHDAKHVSFVSYNGALGMDGFFAGSDKCEPMPVCPALRLNISNPSLWSYAGTVNCGDKPPVSDSVTAGKKKVAKITLKGISKKLAAGKKVSLSASVLPEDAENKSLSWSSSNTGYAMVDQRGTVTLKKAGAGQTVTIMAKANDGSGVQKAYRIKVMKDAVKSIQLKKSPKSIKAGKSVTLKAKVKTTGKKANKTLQWESSNTGFASVSQKGVVKAKNAGKGKTVKITARATDGSNKKVSVTMKIK